MPPVGSWRALAVAAVLAGGSASAAPGSAVYIRSIAFRMKNVELPSGLRVVVEEDKSQPLVAIVSVVDAGSAQDPVGKEGLAHLVEHLTFRTRPDGNVQRSTQLEFAAAGYWNAGTTHDLTRYVTLGPKEAFAQLLAVEGQRLASPLAGLDARTFEAEQAVVRNEITERDEQGEVSAVQARLYGALYPVAHPYHRPVGGTEATISTLTLADAEAFVRQYYLPRNITLYVSGDVDLATVEKVLDASLPRELRTAPESGAVASPKRLGDVSAPVPALPGPAKLETIRAPSERPMLYVAWSLPGGMGSQGYLDRFALWTFRGSTGGAVSRSSDIEGMGATLAEGRYGNTLICRVVLKEGRNPEKSFERVLDQLYKMWAFRTGGFGDEMEFGRMQKTAMVGVALQTESILSRALDKATLIHWTGDPRAWGRDVGGIYGLNMGKLTTFAYEWMRRDRARAVFVEPGGETSSSSELASTPGVFGAGDDVRIKVAPGALSTYVHGPVSEVHSFVLKNGLEVLFVQRPSAPTVAVTFGIHGGEATSQPLGVAKLAPFLAEPTQTYNGPPSRYGAPIWLSSSADASYYTGRAASGNLENVLAIISDSVKSLHVGGGAWPEWPELVDNQRRFDGLPSVQADRAFLAQVFRGSPLGRRAVAADIDRLVPGDVQTWIDRSFFPRGAVLAVVGDLDVSETEKQVRYWYESWEGAQDPRAEAPITAPTSELGGPVRVVRVDRRGVKQTEIRLGCSMRPESPVELISLRLLGTQLTRRLWSLARTSLGGSYGFYGGASLHRQAASLDIRGSVDDRVLSRILALARTALDELGTVSVSEDELGLLKWRQGIASNLSYRTNVELARGLVSARLAGLPVDAIAKFPELLGGVTPEDVRRVAAACRQTAVLVVSGEPDVVTKALQATAR